MADRKLNQSERGINPMFGSNEKSRDRADARRQIEGLNQNDQIVALLGQQNELLRYMCDRLQAIEVKLGPNQSA